MGAYKRVVVAVIKMGAYIHGCLFCVGGYYPDFTVVMETTCTSSLQGELHQASLYFSHTSYMHVTITKQHSALLHLQLFQRSDLN